MYGFTLEELYFIGSVSGIWSDIIIFFFFYLFSNKIWMQINAIFNTAGGKTIRFVLIKVIFAGYEEHSFYNKG